MQASELRPGQFFQYLTWRCMCVQVCQPTQTVVYVFQHGKSWDISRCGFRCQVTPLNVTGWDDEPQTKAFGCCDTPSCNNHVIHKKYDADGLAFCDECEPTPAPLQLREGAWYRIGVGEVIKEGDEFSEDAETWRPVERVIGMEVKRSWLGFYRRKVAAEVPPPECPNNLGSANCPTLCEPCKNEVPPPVEPEQFKPGDWVVCVDAEYELLAGGIYKIRTIYSEMIGPLLYMDGCFMSYRANRFRRATPAEVAAYKQAQEPQQLKPACLADGKSCDRNTACAGSVCAFFECQEPQPDADGWIEWKGGECPVDGKQLVEIKCRGESIKTGTGPAHMWLWKHSKSDSDIDITHYRLVPSPQPAPIITDWVEVVTR